MPQPAPAPRREKKKVGRVREKEGEKEKVKGGEVCLDHECPTRPGNDSPTFKGENTHLVAVAEKAAEGGEIIKMGKWGFFKVEAKVGMGV